MPQWIFRLFFSLVALSLVFGLHVYLYRRLVRDVTESRLIRRLSIAALVLLTIALPLTRFLLQTRAPVWLGVALTSWWGIVIYGSMGLVVLDLARAVALGLMRRRQAGAMPATPAPVLATSPAMAEGDAALSGVPSIDALAPAEPLLDGPADFSRRKFLSRAVAAGALAAGGGVSSFGIYRAMTPPQVTELPIRLPGLPKALEGFTIVQLSDIHIGPVIRKEFVDTLVNEANAQKPDLVAITGDLIDGSPDELGRYVARLRNLQSRHGTFFVSGNHDYYSGWARWAPVISSMGMRVLHNERVAIGDASASFDLLGVEDWGSHWRVRQSDYDLDKAAAGLAPGRASVLLAHQPTNLDAVAAKGIGLQLSGHTHGGQMFPATLIAGMIYGRHVAGHSTVGNTQQFTSRGCGFVGPPMRVDSPPEVVKIVLLPA